MRLTEAEAKTKWCPFARVTAQVTESTWSGIPAEVPRTQLRGLATVNRGGSGSADEVRCLGSACMAWRWDAPPSARIMVTWEGKPEEEWDWDPAEAAGYERAVIRRETAPAAGYCGLAEVRP